MSNLEILVISECTHQEMVAVSKVTQLELGCIHLLLPLALEFSDVTYHGVDSQLNIDSQTLFN
jgi:hypothetical protein